MLRLSDSICSPPALVASSSHKHDVHRPRGLWLAALNSTKGLFGHPTRAPPHPSDPTSHKRIHKSPSTPAFRQHAISAKSASCRDPSIERARIPNMSSSSMPTSATAAAASLGRPIISSPSLPTHFHATDLLHPKLAFPLSPMPSPVGSTFSIRTFPAKLPFSKFSSEDDATVSARIDVHPVRRRTKSAPGIRPGKRFHTSLDLESQRDSTDLGHRCSDASSIPSPPPETPILPLETTLIHFHSPVHQDGSPRTLAAVKRKPVPLHLYSNSANPSLSTSHTASFGMPESASKQELSCRQDTGKNVLAPPRHLVRRPNRMSSKNHAEGPSKGQLPQANACGYKHLVCSYDEHKHDARVNPDEFDMMNTWYEGVSMHSPQMDGRSSTVSDPSANPDTHHCGDGLPHSPPQTPPSSNASDLRSSISIKIPAGSINSRGSALSPLTDEEIRAIRNFLQNHEAGNHERRRRKKDALKTKRPTQSEPYDVHTQIFESYLEKDLPRPAESEDENDVESCAPPSSIAADSASDLGSFSEPGAQDAKNATYEDVTRNSEKDANLPIGKSNRETFGYYDVPMLQSPLINQETRKVYAYTYVPESREQGLGQDDWRLITGSFGNEESIMSIPAADNALGLIALDDNCSRVTHSIDAAPRSIPQINAQVVPKDSNRTPSNICRGPTIMPGVPRCDGFEFGQPALQTSVSPSQGMKSATAAGIGLAILPPEQIALFSACDFNVSLQSGFDGSPRTLDTPSPQGINSELESLSISFERMQTNLARIQAQDSELQDSSLAKPLVALKPALQISPIDSAMTYARLETPSPTDTIAISTPQVSYKISHHICDETMSTKSNCRSAQIASGDETTSFHSFIHLTPNAPTPKQRSRARLRKLFSLKGPSA